MQITRRQLGQLLATSPTLSLFAADSTPSYNLKYDGGSIEGLKHETDLKIFISGESLHFTRKKEDVLIIPAGSVLEVSYGQDVHRRVGAAIGLALVSFGIGALMALAKSKKHFIGLTWEIDGKKGGAAFQAEKGNYRGVLAGIEGVTGKKAVNSDAMTVKN